MYKQMNNDHERIPETVQTECREHGGQDAKKERVLEDGPRARP